MKARKRSHSPMVTSAGAPPTREQIEALAQAIWKDRGCPEGRDIDNWLEAERQLRGDIRVPEAADDIPATNDELDPDRDMEGPVERELDQVVKSPQRRSPTAL